MAYNEKLAERVRGMLAKRDVTVTEKAMFGGLCFLVNGKMCVGVYRQRLLARLDPEMYEAVLTRKGCVPMDSTGRPMRGFVFVNRDGTNRGKDLEFWIEMALEFNPRAKKSKRRKPSGRVMTKKSRKKV